MFVHHKMEDRMIQLSHVEFAELFPYEYQKPVNLVYCDYLEHLLLHILICEIPEDIRPERPIASTDSEFGRRLNSTPIDVGIGGAVIFIDELDKCYKGRIPIERWRKNCFNTVKNDKNVYVDLYLRTYFIMKEKKYI